MHTVTIDGVYSLDEDTGLPRFHFQAASTPSEMQAVTQTVRDRVLKMLRRQAVAIKRKVNCVFDADIRAFYDTIDHAWMQKIIEHKIADRRMVRLLMKWLHAGVVENGELHEVHEGAPQGGGISPLLSNIYLHYVIDLWVQQWRKRYARGEVYIVSYADDVVMGFQYEQDAHAMRAAMADRYLVGQPRL